MTETIELSLPPRPLRYPVELVGQVTRWINGRNLSYEFDVEKRVRYPCRLLARAGVEHDSPFRPGIAEMDENGYVDLSVISALAEGDYLYRLGEPLTPSLDDRVTALERVLGLVADDLEVASDAELEGRREDAAVIRLRAIARIRGER